MSKVILITGGRGFIGTNLCNELARRDLKSKIIAIDNMRCSSLMPINPNIHIVNKDIVNLDFCREILYTWGPIDEIYHLASIASPVWYKTFPFVTIETNVVGTDNMCWLAQKVGAKLLLSSTSEIYGAPEVHPQREDYFGHRNSVGDRSCYDCSKAIAETIVYEYQKNGLNATIVRIFNTYGPGMRCDDGRVVSEFICRTLKNEPVTIYNGGNQTRSFCYIDDMVEYLIRAMKCKHPGPINIGNDNERSISNLAYLIERIFNKKLNKIHKVVNDNDPRRRKPDLALARNILNYTPNTPIMDGLIKTVLYFKELMK